jgi:hypothetical protein
MNYLAIRDRDLAAAKAGMARADAGIFPSPWPKLRLAIWPVIIVAIVGLQIIRSHPSSFKDRKALIHSLIFDLKFPGYGEGGIGEAAQTDDGSALEVNSVEIPQRGKERYIVVRGEGGQLNLGDDFVRETGTNTIRGVKLEKQTLRYYDSSGNLVREKKF